MKKVLGVFVLGMIMLSFGMSIVSAAGIVEGMQGIIEGVYDVIEPALSVVVGETGHGNIFVAKILFLIIIFAIVWKALEQIPFFSESGWVLWVVSIAVSIVSVRWIGDSEVVTAILLPYSAFGIALTAGLPFILYFFVVKDFNQTMRKISWIFFAVVFIGLWAIRSGDVAPAPRVGPFAYIYLITAGLALAMLKFDGTIHKLLTKIKIEKSQEYMMETLVDEQHDKIDDAKTRYAKGTITEADMKRRVKTAERKITAIEKHK